MRLLEEHDRRFVNIEKKIGLFVVSALAGIALVVAFIGVQQEVFTTKAHIRFIADSGTDLSEGQAVKFKGFRIGKIERVSLNDEAKVEVRLSINKGYLKWIKSDSAARLAQEGVIGDNIIEIMGGSAEAKQVEEEGQIRFEREKGINQLFEDLKGEIELALIDLKKIIHYVNDPEGDIKLFIANIHRLAEELRGTRARVDALLENTDANLSGTLGGIDEVVGSIQNTILPSVEQALESARKTLDQAGQDMPGLLDSAGRSLKNIESITEDIKRASPDVPVLLQESGEVVGGAKEVVDSLKDTWPISSGIEEPAEKPAAVDSYE